MTTVIRDIPQPKTIQQSETLYFPKLGARKMGRIRAILHQLATPQRDAAGEYFAILEDRRTHGQIVRPVKDAAPRLVTRVTLNMIRLLEANRLIARVEGASGWTITSRGHAALEAF